MIFRRLPIGVSLVLLCYVAFALAWTFSAGPRSPDQSPTRTAMPTFAVDADAEVLRVATATLALSATPTPHRMRTRPTATSTKKATPTSTTTQTPTATSVPHSQHRVASGDTMWGIAVRYGVAYQELLDANPGIDPKLLWEGQEISVPVDASSVDLDGAYTHTVGDGETVWGIAQLHEIEVQELLRINGMDASSVIRPGDELILPILQEK